MKRVLFVCHANVCRSPMAQAMFEAMARDKKLPHRAESAGVAAVPGTPIGSSVRAVLGEFGIAADEHRARRVSGEMIREADLVLTMSPAHLRELRRDFAEHEGKVHTLPEYAGGAAAREGEISDPHGLTMNAHRACARQLLACVESVVDRLAAETS